MTSHRLQPGETLGRDHITPPAPPPPWRHRQHLTAWWDSPVLLAAAVAFGILLGAAVDRVLLRALL